MRIKAHVSIFILSILVSVFLFTLSNADIAQAMAVPFGCCTTEEEGGQCIGCPEGQACNTFEEYCIQEDGFFNNFLVCQDSGNGATCAAPQAEFGCCVVEPGDCTDNLDTDQCFFGMSETAQIWVPGQSCSAVSECTITRNIPAMSNWGLIALAGIFILAGVWAITRKKAQA